MVFFFFSFLFSLSFFLLPSSPLIESNPRYKNPQAGQVLELPTSLLRLSCPLPSPSLQITFCLTCPIEVGLPYLWTRHGLLPPTSIYRSFISVITYLSTFSFLVSFAFPQPPGFHLAHLFRLIRLSCGTRTCSQAPRLSHCAFIGCPVPSTTHLHDTPLDGHPNCLASPCLTLVCELLASLPACFLLHCFAIFGSLVSRVCLIIIFTLIGACAPTQTDSFVRIVPALLCHCSAACI